MNQTLTQWSLSRNIELVFWDIYIYVLSKSKLVRKVFKFFATLSITYDLTDMTRKVGILSITGLLFGSAVSLLINFLTLLLIQ